MYDIAIIGGMGPAATAELFNRIIKYTSADTDQEHIKICVLNDPTIPDRTNYILHGGESPLPKIKKNINLAKQLSCQYYVIPCNTSHYFFKDYEAVSEICFINMIYEACKYAAAIYPKKKLCVLATEGTIYADVYKKIGGSITKIVYLSEKANKRIMELIREIKTGKADLQAISRELYKLVSAEYHYNDTVFILACTELSLLLPYLTSDFLDAMDILAGIIVTKCKKTINNEQFRLNEAYFYENA